MKPARAISLGIGGIVLFLSVHLAGCAGGGSDDQSEPRKAFRVFQNAETPPEISYMEISPERVLIPSGTEPVTFTFRFQPEVDIAEFWLPGNRRIRLDRTGQYTWTKELGRSDIFRSYVNGEALAFVGYCDTYVDGSRWQRLNIFLPVRTPSMPDIAYTAMAQDMQMSDYVLNIRHDSLLLGGSTVSSVWDQIRSRAEAAIGPVDHFALVGQVNAFANRTGGSLLCFPNTSFFDLANKGAVHEIGHGLGLAYSNISLLADYGHWRMGNAAYGVMGWADPAAGGQGLSFPYLLEPGDSPGTTHVLSMEQPTEFNNIELYKLGLIPESAVEPILQFSDQKAAVNWMLNPYSVGSCGAGCSTVDIESKYITIDDIVASDGPSLPSVKTEVTVGTVVLSRGRLLNADEMAFYDHMTARGEATEPLPVMEGFAVYTGKPLYVATRGKMTLSARIR